MSGRHDAGGEHDGGHGLAQVFQGTGFDHLAARSKKSLHAAPSACCPPRGRFLPWGGPAAKKDGYRSRKTTARTPSGTLVS
ncbi:hypothetical protein FOZ76_15435 [Verticiella sediminum]|uniref:Uncharacterized protein n=1 Tax=Verticiella sediminum TaxID=1247510 RepID=A0A556AIR2_9BURK|nr:hypothetical protein FOZ76_15435 [Verticiella sediminum]